MSLEPRAVPVPYPWLSRDFQMAKNRQIRLNMQISLVTTCDENVTMIQSKYEDDTIEMWRWDDRNVDMIHLKFGHDTIEI
jgi:hypothetical protein